MKTVTNSNTMHFPGNAPNPQWYFLAKNSNTSLVAFLRLLLVFDFSGGCIMVPRDIPSLIYEN